MKIILVAAVAADGGIGRGNALLFDDPADKRHFVALTRGKPVVMGRRTWESLPPRWRPLPGRRNVVLTRDAGYVAEGAETATGLDAVLERLAGAEEVCVIGGGQIYAEALPRADRLELTEVAKTFPGADAFFPVFDRQRFTERARRAERAADGTPFAFVTYERVRA